MRDVNTTKTYRLFVDWNFTSPSTLTLGLVDKNTLISQAETKAVQALLT